MPRRQTALAAAAALAAALVGAVGYGWQPGDAPGPWPLGSESREERADADYAWDEDEAPEYYLVVGEAQEGLASEVTADEDVMSAVDVCGIDVPSMSQIRATYSDVERAQGSERTDLPDPAFWPENFECSIVCPDGSTYRGWFWNRSHLVARSLGGADEAGNLIAGTRMQNVGGNDGEGGMAYTESLARAYLEGHRDGWVCYRATAVYLGLEWIPRAVRVDVLSDDGSLDLSVVVFNAAKGYSIDYATGEVSAA